MEISDVRKAHYFKVDPSGFGVAPRNNSLKLVFAVCLLFRSTLNETATSRTKIGRRKVAGKVDPVPTFKPRLL